MCVTLVATGGNEESLFRNSSYPRSSILDKTRRASKDKTRLALEFSYHVFRLLRLTSLSTTTLALRNSFFFHTWHTSWILFPFLSSSRCSNLHSPLPIRQALGGVNIEISEWKWSGETGPLHSRTLCLRSDSVIVWQ